MKRMSTLGYLEEKFPDAGKKMIATNIGAVPVEDYLDIKARQYGFDDYEEMRAAGLYIAPSPSDVSLKEE